MSGRIETEPHEIERAGRALGWVVFGALGGQAVTGLPFFTSVWGAGAVGAVLVFSHARHRIPKKARVAALLGALAVSAFCVFKAVREYTGADYKLGWRTCGKESGEYGYLSGAFFGLEWVNNNKVDLHILPTGRFFTLKANDGVKDRTAASKLPLENTIVTIHPSTGSSVDDAKITDQADFDAAMAPPKHFTGSVHDTFRYGRDASNLNQTLTVDGEINMDLAPDGSRYRFRWSPRPDSSSGYQGTCDIEQQIRAPA